MAKNKHNIDQRPNTKPGLAILLPLIDYVRPYKKSVAAALLALVFTAGVSLSIGQSLQMVIDQGFIGRSKEALTYSIGYWQL